MRDLLKFTTIIVILTLFVVLAGCQDPENLPEVPTTYTITINDSDNGTVTASKSAANEGDTIVLSPTSNHTLGYELASYSVKTASGTKVNVTNHEFTMPAENVTVDSVFWNKTGFVHVAGATVSGAVSSNPPFGQGTSYPSGVFINNRTVTIPNMYVCDHEVTQSEYQTYCNYSEQLQDTYAGPVQPRNSSGEGANYPAFNVTWYDAIVYCNLRSIAEKLTPVYKIGNETDPSKWPGIQHNNGKYCGPSSNNPSITNNTTWDNVTYDQTANGYRLPTDAEWEFTARNRNLDSYNYSGSNDFQNVAWVLGYSNNTTHVVKTKNANSLGIYDMSGNVWEWCWDWSGSITSSTPSIGAPSGTLRVLRGGSWKWSPSQNAMVHFRHCRHPLDAPDGDYDRGFRVVRTAFTN